jgi:hypothetical protein
MPIPSITRQIQTIDITAAYSLTDPSIEQVIADVTAGAYQLTIYDDLDSGTYHRLVVKISDDDTSGNTLTIANAGGTFSTTLASTSAAVELETDAEGGWLAVATFPTLDANTAISAADSAGVEASEAQSVSASAGAAGATALSAAASGTTLATSEATSAGAAAAGALSAAASGTTLATSEATSAGLAGSVALSAAASGTTLATSEATSAGAAASTSLSAAVSAGEAASVALSTAAS